MIQKLFPLCLSGLSTLSVLGILLGLGIWGHHTHWKIPRFQQLIGNEEAPFVAPAAEEESEYLDSARSAYPPIFFKQKADVRYNGLSVSPARLQPLKEYVTANAVVGYNERHVAQLSARVPGHVWKVRTQVGQAVKKGEVLALIDAPEVGQAKADYLQEMVLAWYQGQKLRQLQELGTDVIARRLILEAESLLKETQLKKFHARQRLLNLGIHPGTKEDAALPLAELSRRIQFLGLPRQVLAELKEQPPTANLIALIAPFDGIVIEQHMVAGEMVRPETPQIVMADVSSMWINLSVRGEDAARLQLGQTVEFVADDVAVPVLGKLTWVSTEVDKKTRTVQARCEVANPWRDDNHAADGIRLLRANLFGTARIQAQQHPSTVTVPVAAIQWLPDLTPLVFIRVADGLAFQPRRVRLGISGNGFTQVLEGVQAGEPVVTQGGHILKSELLRRAAADKS